MKTIDKQKIVKEGELDKTVGYNETEFKKNMEYIYQRMAKIVDFLLATMFVITIVSLCIATIAWLFGSVAPWPIWAVIIIVLLLFGLLNNK